MSFLGPPTFHVAFNFCGISDDCVSCELCRYQEKKRLSKSSDSSQTSITPSVTPMEGSWLVTPPPCFMSRSQCLDSGDTRVVDPLENLLIEHPSMSVYRVNPQNLTVSPCTSVGLQRRLTRQHHNQVFGYEIELRPQWLKNKRLACRESHLLNRGNKAMTRHNKATNRNQECKPLQAYKRKL